MVAELDGTGLAWQQPLGASAPIWQCVMVVDIAESVRLIHAHEADVIERWLRFVAEVRTQVAPARGGRVVKSLGDGLLMTFDLVTTAAAAALDLQHRVAAYNTGRLDDATIRLRIGLHAGEVRVGADDIYGDAVNVAARLASLAAPGEVVASADVHDHLVPGVDGDIEDLGECFVRHLDAPLRVFRLGAAAPISALDSVAQRAGNEIRPGVAVIPFECSLGNDPGDLLGEALADEVISQLARSKALHVISGLSTRGLKGRRLGVGEISQYLGASHVLSGRYRLAGTGFRLHVELADVRRQRVLWAEAFDSDPAAAFDPEAPLADRIVTEVGRAILEQAMELVETQPLPTLESYTLLFGAVSLMHRASAREFDRARLMLEHLAERQGRRGVAHAWLAKWHVLRVVQGWTPDAQAECAMAQDRVRRALDASPHDGLALAIGGLVHGYLRKDMDTAGRLYDDARAANPNEPLAWLFSATRHAWRGEGAEAVRAGEMALSLSPLDPMRYFFDSLVATATLAGDDAARAVELARRSIRANRTHASTWRTLIYALVKQGRVDEARAAAGELLAIEPALTLRRFRERFPGRGGPMEQPWAEALAVAGVPA